MNLILLDKTELDGDVSRPNDPNSSDVPGESERRQLIRLDDRRATHLRKVLRVEPGRTLRIGVVGGGRGVATVVAIEGKTVVLDVDPSTLEHHPPPKPRLSLILALPRPAVLHRLLQLAATVQVEELILTNSWRVEKSFFGSPALEPEAIDRHLRLGAEQGMTTRLPEVRIENRFVDMLTALVAPSSTELRLVAHPDSPSIETVLTADHAPASHHRLAIGPEGGWIDREIESFAENGFTAVGIGPWILRVEAAVAAFVGITAALERARDRRGTLELI
ncbi:MAG: RsmE family RNA methyltransferase [Acidobacteriota bacterium]